MSTQCVSVSCTCMYTVTMLFTIELFLTLLFAVSNVFADENDDAMACLQLFNPNTVGQECCENFERSETFNADITECFDSDDVSCDNIECILKKRGMMDGENIDEDAAKKIFEKIMKDNPKDKDIAERVLQECMDGKFNEYPPEDACPAFKLFTCVFLNAQLGCQKWKSTDECTKMADNAKKCRALVDN